MATKGLGRYGGGVKGASGRSARTPSTSYRRNTQGNRDLFGMLGQRLGGGLTTQSTMRPMKLRVADPPGYDKIKPKPPGASAQIPGNIGGGGGGGWGTGGNMAPGFWGSHGSVGEGGQAGGAFYKPKNIPGSGPMPLPGEQQTGPDLTGDDWSDYLGEGDSFIGTLPLTDPGPGEQVPGYATDALGFVGSKPWSPTDEPYIPPGFGENPYDPEEWGPGGPGGYLQTPGGPRPWLDSVVPTVDPGEFGPGGPGGYPGSGNDLGFPDPPVDAQEAAARCAGGERQFCF